MKLAEIIGDKELLKKLKELGGIRQHKEISDAAFRGAKHIERRAKARASTVTEKKTGKLQKAIKAKRGTGRNKGTATVDVDRKIAPHSHLIEFGTGPRHHKKTGKYTGQMPARPYFRPTIDTSKGRVARIIKKGVETAIEKAAKK